MVRTGSKISALVVALALVLSLASPKPAAAASAGEITLYVVGGLTVFVGLVIVGTLLTRKKSKMFVAGAEEPEDRKDRVAFGFECMTPDGTPALVCW